MENSINYPNFDNLDLLKNSSPIENSVLEQFNGIYNIASDKIIFGKIAVVKASSNYLSFFCEANGSYIIVKGGIKDSMLKFQGYWRLSAATNTGKFTIEMPLSSLLSNFKNGKLDSNFKFIGFATTPNGRVEEITFSFNKPINNSSKNFYIIAHRGGGRNSDYLPYSENSIELMKYAHLLGANSIEIDVQSSKDKIPFIYHDSYFSTRLIQGEFLVGSTSNFTLQQIKTFGKLKNGENIPTLDEALRAVVYETNLELVWVDCKSASIVKQTAEIINKYNKLANNIGRKIKICIGIPSDEVLNEFKLIENYKDINSICELSVDKVLEINSIAFGPIWSKGLLANESEIMRKNNKLLFVWTLDEASFIDKYLKSGYYDGMVTNYPSVVAFNYYTKYDN
jgi:glycerophosphoryl diester phosphodiesterase